MKKILIIMCCFLLLLTLNLSISVAASDEFSSTGFNQKEGKKAIFHVMNALKEDYVYHDKALLIEEALTWKMNEKWSDNINDWYDFTREINALLRKVSGDNYLELIEPNALFSLETLPKTLTKNAQQHPNIDIVDVLTGNIGYLKFNSLSQQSSSKKAIFSAFSDLSTVDALIIDLRDTEGGSIDLVRYIASFFVEENTLLCRYFYNPKDSEQQLLSVNNHINEKLKRNFPVYILTSAFVSGTGELLTYTLKHLKKAVVIGDKTMGVAYVLKTRKINQYINLKMPIAVPVNPLTNGNWEQTGVIPDVDVSAKKSLEEAHKMAKQFLGTF